jgi:serine/threonine protein kinase
VSTATQRIGRYILLETVGRGAMGVVYRAEDPVIHRTVAVKVLHTVNGLTAEQVGVARDRFSREGQALGSLDHPNIIRVFDVGEDPESGEMYIVMEFVSGPQLETVIAEGAIDRGRVVAIIGQLASGLDAAHARGIIHRDIKPSNILLTEDGTAKIADFGITRVESSALTRDMRELGTPAYMSPEQVAGKVLDSRADLFSLGVMTYEMLSGRKPFGGSEIIAIAHAIAYATPVLISEANPALPKSFDPVLERILAKDPSHRFATGAAFHQALHTCLLDEAERRVSRPSLVAGKRRPIVWGLAAVAVLAAAFLLTRWTGTSGAPRPAPPSSVTQVPTIANAAPAPFEPKISARKSASSQKPQASKPAKKAVAKPGPSIEAPPKGRAAETAKATPPPAVAKAAPAVAPKPMVDVTIRFAHRLRRGKLVVLLDGVAIFSENFSKAKLALVQTTVWDPLKAPAGRHTLTARVSGEDGATYVSEAYKLEFPPEQGVELRIGLKGDALTVKQKAG